jgi:short-subunit dehydrogenase
MDKKLRAILTAVGGAVVAAGLARAAIVSRRRISLRGKCVLVTGGSRGLGLVLARELAEEGARVAICARSEEELERVRAEFAGRGQRLVTEICDVGIQSEVERCVYRVRDQLGAIDVLINNAGQMVVGPAENHETSTFEDTLQTNFWGPYYATLAIIPQMRARRAGRIVNITSIGGKLAFPHLLPYSVSKFALVGYSEGLRAELLKYNVYVTTVCPGLMRTGSPRNADFTGKTEEEYAWFKISDSIPGASISAKSAARKIIRGLVNGEAEIHLGLAAQLGSVVHGIAPGIIADVFGLLNEHLMPDAKKGPAEVSKGLANETEATQSEVTRLTQDAEIANNQL